MHQDPRTGPRKRTSLKEQILVVLMTVGIAITVTGLAAGFL